MPWRNSVHWLVLRSRCSVCLSNVFLQARRQKSFLALLLTRPLTKTCWCVGQHFVMSQWGWPADQVTTVLVSLFGFSWKNVEGPTNHRFYQETVNTGLNILFSLSLKRFYFFGWGVTIGLCWSHGKMIIKMLLLLLLMSFNTYLIWNIQVSVLMHLCDFFPRNVMTMWSWVPLRRRTWTQKTFKLASFNLPTVLCPIRAPAAALLVGLQFIYSPFSRSNTHTYTGLVQGRV